MHASVAKHTDKIIELCKKHGLLRLEVFGSAARGTDFNEAKSDIDLIAKFDYAKRRQTFDEYFALVEDLENLVGRTVDLSEDVPIDNIHLRKSINQSRELLYEA